MLLTISSPMIAELLEAAAASPDVEICGLLLGRDDVVEAVVPCANVAGDPRDSFEIDPAALISAHRAARTGGAAPIGHYHSHPRGTATPSARDAAAAEPGSYWIIIAGTDLRCWRAAEGRRFDPVAIAAPDG
ncbi:MAG: M67 family metallopeptidase [Sphingomonas sp.]|jgi:proteasome lid subunit RPN8/RPN11|nr:M67 family metallopeptidase [Sphingomonas sp.]